MNWNDDEMRVKKRNGTIVTISFDKILNRIKKIGQEHDIHIRYSNLAMRIIDQLYDGIETSKIDELTAQQCASQVTLHPDYGKMASVLSISNLHKETPGDFLKITKTLFEFKDIHGKSYPMVSEKYYNIVSQHSEKIMEKIDYNNDYTFDYFGYKTLERAYLMKIDNQIIERPQHMIMRVAIGIHGNNIKEVIKTYDLIEIN